MTVPPAPDAEALLQAAPVALLHVDAAGLLGHCNAAAQALCGEAATPGRPWRGIFAAHNAAALPALPAAAPQRLALNHDPACTVDLTAQALPGGGWMLALHAQHVAAPATSNASEPAPARGGTDARSLPREADDMAQRFERATAAAGIGYWVLLRSETRATWSPALRQIFDLPPATPAPTSAEWVARHVHPADRDEVRLQFAAWARNGRESLALPLRIVRPDGSLRYLSTHTLIERGGAQPLMFGVVVDLTAGRSAELALRNAQERVALAARGAGLGTWELDVQTGEAFWDEQMWLLRGHAPQPGAMHEAERLACLHPDDRAAVHTLLSDALVRGTPFENEFRVVWPDGQLRWLASRSAEIRDEQTGARRRIGVNWDVTDKRTAEGARREREMAQRESQAKSRFLARMSHELRTPLNAVLGFSQLLLAEVEDDGPRASTRRRQLEHIRGAGEHLLALIDDVLDLSSLESGELRIQLQPVALEPLLAQTVPMLDTLRRKHGIELQLGALPGMVIADATRLRQVLLNLLSNALKYNRPGGHVRVDSRRQGADWLIRVADSGRGMSAEQLHHLYEPFNRLGRQSEGADGVEGSGIGLAIVKALMERMGGSVRVQSTPGVGSVFELCLADAAPKPLPGGTPAAPAITTCPLPPGADLPPRPRRPLLYIEDNAVNALIVSELMARRADLQLHIAVDGSSGVQRALELQPDLVLLDMQLPDFDGHEVLRRLRAHPALAQVPVIALSANAVPEDIERALRAGMAEYWTKPLDLATFMAAIDRLFGKE
jgi:signal transduction histidine kinase/CheY-like chemotaxis protein